MNDVIRTIVAIAGTITFLHGLVLQRWALARHRATDSDGPWLSWRPSNWRAKRDWFSSDYGYRLYRWAQWHTLVGGLIMLVVWNL